MRIAARWLAPITLLAFVVWKLAFSLWARFAFDDMMNLGSYWTRGGWEYVLKGLVQFWSTAYRPMGGLFYMALFERYGFDPYPYRVVIFALLLVNAWLAYEVALLLSRRRGVSLIAAAATSVHAAFFALYMNTSQVYDALCFLFYFAALAVWIRWGSRGKALAGVALLYIGALTSKEMAVSFPIIVGLYELTHRRPLNLRRLLLPFGVLGVISLAYVIGKVTGPDSLTAVSAYKPVITVGRFLDNNAKYAAELFRRPNLDAFDKADVLLIWGALLYFAVRQRKRYLFWGLGLATLGTLPIAFIPDRGGACLPIPAFGYALFAGAIVDLVARWMAREPLWVWLRIPSQVVYAAGLGAALLFWSGDLNKQKGYVLEAWQRTQDMTWAHIQNMERLVPTLPKEPRELRILFTDDPFQDWDIWFITKLAFRDRPTDIHLQRKLPKPPTAEELAGYHVVLRATATELVRLR